MATDTPRIPEQGVATLPDEAWERARRRAEIISPLAQSETVGHEAADMAAQALGLSRRQVYVLIRRARQGSGLVTDLVPGQSGGGKGKGRLPEPVERVIHELLQKRFLTKQKRSLAAFHREVTQVCKAQKLRVPARNTDIDNLSRNQDIAVGLQVILKPRARPTPTWTSMPERTLDFEF